MVGFYRYPPVSQNYLQSFCADNLYVIGGALGSAATGCDSIVPLPAGERAMRHLQLPHIAASSTTTLSHKLSPKPTSMGGQFKLSQLICHRARRERWHFSFLHGSVSMWASTKVNTWTLSSSNHFLVTCVEIPIDLESMLKLHMSSLG